MYSLIGAIMTNCSSLTKKHCKISKYHEKLENSANSYQKNWKNQFIPGLISSYMAGEKQVNLCKYSSDRINSSAHYPFFKLITKYIHFVRLSWKYCLILDIKQNFD